MRIFKGIILASMLFSVSSVVAQELPIICTISNSDKKIIYTADDLIFATRNNLIFQHDSGVLVSHVDVKAETFIQISQLKDQDYPNRPLVLFGHCSDVRASLSTWLLD
ncbi:hypothetical protein [Photobacterium indicum]|uniref:Uncharacterized protein n=1 Tax=Photobacterium indicum TaxID=81447 RepID=A0A2T3L3Z4_9GAMM|nr:hypothetical protein [Photobacterium indicum]PSV44060.1 hypothetical protein C9J47_20580 [Photobacterium indicum]